MNRRQFLSSAIALTTIGLTDRGLQAKPWISDNPAIAAIDKFLQEHKNKHVVAYWAHSSIALQQLYSTGDFWKTLGKNGFTNQFMEAVENEQLPLNEAAAGKLFSGIQLDYWSTSSTYLAHINGVSLTAVDRGERENLHLTRYPGHIKSLWRDHKAANKLSFSADEIEQEIDQQARFIRELMAKSDVLKAMAQEYRVFLHRRNNDAKTGLLSGFLSSKAPGRVWQDQGLGHFTACGLHTYIKDALVLSLYDDARDMREEDAKQKYPDVFISYALHIPVVPYYAFLLKETKIIEKTPDPVAVQNAQNIKAECIALTGSQKSDEVSDLPRYQTNPSIRSRANSL